MNAKLLSLEEIAAKVGNYAQAMLEMCEYEGVGHIVMLVRNSEQGGSYQVTATNIPADEAAEFLTTVATELAAGLPPMGETSS